jgi:hypothetical protein
MEVRLGTRDSSDTCGPHDETEPVSLSADESGFNPEDGSVMFDRNVG